MSTDRNPSPQARFARDERGAVLVLWALFLAVAFGFLALAFDLGRLATTQTQLQSFADQVALAAAGELDGRPGARARATAAANGLIDGQQTYAQGAQALDADDFTLVFLSNLPANDRDAATAVATNDASARFVRVVVDRRTVLTPFANVTATLNGNARISADVGAEATAGFSSYACDITPLFFCVPNPSWRAEAHVGIQVEAVSGSAGNGLWTPGNFGFLDPTILPVDPTGPCRNLNGAQLYRCLVGAERGITTCIETTAPLETRPGQAQGLTEAFNARFDIFQGSMGQYRNNASYRPAPNVLSDQWSTGGRAEAMVVATAVAGRPRRCRRTCPRTAASPPGPAVSAVGTGIATPISPPTTEAARPGRSPETPGPHPNCRPGATPPATTST
jgi:Flp pilus assembly protein TadG